MIFAEADDVPLHGELRCRSAFHLVDGGVVRTVLSLTALILNVVDRLTILSHFLHFCQGLETLNAESLFHTSVLFLLSLLGKGLDAVLPTVFGVFMGYFD